MNLHASRDSSARFDPLDLRKALGQFPQAVVAISSHIDGAPEVLVASSFTVGVSLEPALVTVAVQHTSVTWPKLREDAPVLGISVLGKEQAEFARQLASKDRESRFSGIEHSTHTDGAVILEGSPLWFKARLYEQFTAGDHDVAVLEIVDFGFAENVSGLVFHQSQFKGLIPVS